MTKKDFVILCLRLLGIYFIVMGLASLSSITSMAIGPSDIPVHLFVGPLFYVLSGMVLCVYAAKLCRFVVEFSEAEDDNVKITASEKTTRIALLILGIFIFAQALPSFIKSSIEVGLYYKSINEIPSHLREAQHRWTYLIWPVVNLIIAAVLIIGPDKIVGVLGRYDETFRRIKSSEKSNDL
jgi:hypothetical protein